MSAAEILPWFNVLLVPMAAHIMRTETRIARLEERIEMLLRGGR